MSRYFFHVDDDRSFHDVHGTELADTPAARRELMRFASALLADQSNDLWTSGAWTMRVTDDDDRTLLTLSILATDAGLPALLTRVGHGDGA